MKLLKAMFAIFVVSAGAFADQLSSAIPPGKRGFVVRVSTSSANSVRPGDLIDVFAAYDGTHGQIKKLLSDIHFDWLPPVQEKEGAVGTKLVLDLSPLQAQQLARAIVEQHAEISVAPAQSSSLKSSTGMFVGHENWIACENNDQCAMVHAHSCGFIFAINKKYSDEANQFASQRVTCSKPYMYPVGTVATCRNNECVLVFPPKK